MVERAHQTLGGMMKAMMKDSGFPTSFWGDALHYAVYLKNRSLSNATNRTPYEEMWGRKPEIHHVRKFGALAYMHVKVGPSRHKFADNCKVGYVLGYRDGTLGCKVYLPSEGTVQIAGQVTVNEQILYKDRHKDGFDQRVRDWVVEEHPDLTSTGRRDYDLPVVGGRGDAGGSTGGSSDGGSARSARETAQPRNGANNDDYELVDHGNDEDSPNSASSWLQRPLPNFTDEVVLHPDISRINNYFADEETIALVLVYVDDVICATNNETWKSKFFTELNEKYGIKDLGRLHTYLGVQVDLTGERTEFSCTRRSTLKKCYNGLGSQMLLAVGRQWTPQSSCRQREKATKSLGYLTVRQLERSCTWPPVHVQTWPSPLGISVGLYSTRTSITLEHSSGSCDI